MNETNYALGHNAEKRVAKWLTKNGYKILELNWRRPQCEIDIVAQKSTGRIRKSPVVYFIEVKSRSNNKQGDGFDYITTKKLGQMEFAAQTWLADHNWQGESRMAAVAVLGSEFEMVELA